MMKRGLVLFNVFENYIFLPSFYADRFVNGGKIEGMYSAVTRTTSDDLIRMQLGYHQRCIGSRRLLLRGRIDTLLISSFP